MLFPLTRLCTQRVIAKAAYQHQCRPGGAWCDIVTEHRRQIMASELLVSSDLCGPGYINVKCFGAIGQVLATKGTVHAGSNQLTVASVTGWIVDTGVGIVGAGPANASLVTKVVKISGNTLTLA